MKYNIKKAILLFICHCFLLISFAQVEEIKNVMPIISNNYGIDQILVNGKVFRNPYRNDIGHPYYFSDDFRLGSITVHQKTYSNLLLKYNLYDQTVLINYTNGTELIYSPPVDFVSEFTFHNQHFKKLKIGDFKERFYQVIYSGEINCFYFWKKQRGNADKVGKSVHEYYEDEKDMFLLINGSVYSYKGKSSFMKIFPKEKQKQLSKYIKSQKINLKKSSNESISELMVFCEEILNK